MPHWTQFLLLSILYLFSGALAAWMDGDWMPIVVVIVAIIGLFHLFSKVAGR